MSQGLELENRADVVVVSEDVSYSIAICAPQILWLVKKLIIGSWEYFTTVTVLCSLLIMSVVAD